MPRELGAISDVGPVSPHPEEFGFYEIAERPGPGWRGTRDDEDHLSGANRKISRQRNMKFTARWDFRIEIDSPDHGLLSVSLLAIITFSKKAYFAHSVNGVARRKCAVTAL